MFTKATFISALAGLAAAAPTTYPTAPAPETFTAISIRSGDIDLHLRPVAAYQGTLSLGASTQTYCPPAAGSACDSAQKDTTVLVALPNTANTTLSLDVTVPGGQQVYVSPLGMVKFTTAHSGSVPEGSVLTGFKYTPGNTGSLTFLDDSFLACPIGEGKYNLWVAAAFPGYEPVIGCTRVGLATATYDGTAAWQYS